jgi:toxin ParE1/3/4
MKVVFAERARSDIGEIYEHIVQQNRQAAQRVEDMIRASCESLADFPFASSATDEPNVRRLPLVRYSYTIFYRADTVHDLVEIARVIHSARVKDLSKTPSDD